MSHIGWKIRHRRSSLPLLVLIAIMTACQPPAEERLELIDDAQWPYWPISMRFHPLTRFVIDRDTSNLTLETRVEFADRDGDVCRAYGEVRVRLFEVFSTGDSGEKLQEWNIDLRELDRNRDHFDVVTRTYLFRLEVDPELLIPRMELHGRYISEDGRSFDASFLLER